MHHNPWCMHVIIFYLFYYTLFSIPCFHYAVLPLSGTLLIYILLIYCTAIFTFLFFFTWHILRSAHVYVGILSLLLFKPYNIYHLHMANFLVKYASRTCHSLSWVTSFMVAFLSSWNLACSERLIWLIEI